ncbi:hypothetical protein [Bradyrhizobium macuxiense]|nr:hypothetical protein [Bradyrhizobium macuxiense]
MGQSDEQRKLGLKNHARVHFFRISTAILTWILLGATLIYKPEWIRNGMRAGTRAIEAVGDTLPSYWGAQAEIVLRELGGFLWLQITAAILFVRFVLWLVAAAWRWRGR